MKDLIKNIIPESIWSILKNIREFFILIKCYAYDFSRYYKFYSGFRRDNQTSIVSWLLQDCHRIEKGITLENFRSGFGKAVIERILVNYQKVNKKTDLGIEISEMVENTLAAYDSVHIKTKATHPFHSNNNFIEVVKNKKNDISTRHLKLDADNSFQSLLNVRMSIRSFSNECVSNKILEKAVSMAVLSPSVCNRQHWRVHSYTGNKMKSILELQNGNASFREHIHQILVVTSDLGYFVTPMERYQQYIDGGIFSANLLNSLQSHSVYSCALNWSSLPAIDRKLHNLNLFPKEESVIMIIAYGYPLSSDTVSCLSTKLKLNNFLTVH